MDHIFYQKLGDEVVKQNMTSAQVAALTKKQIAALIGVDEKNPEWSGGNEGLAVNIQRNMVESLRRLELEAVAMSIKNTIRGDFPRVYTEAIPHPTEPCIEIWLEGNPRPDQLGEVIK